MIRRSIVVAALVVTCALAGLVIERKAAHAEENIDWNMCGGAGGTNCWIPGSLAQPDQLIFWTVGSTARAAQAQEVCGNQHNYAAVVLSGYGYKNAFYPSNPTGCGFTGHGNAVYWLGSGGVGFGAFAAQCNNTPSCLQQGMEADFQRGWVCGFDGSLGSCSAHMTHRDDNIARNQTDEYRGVLNFIGGGKYGSGDFNLKPNEFASPWLGFSEGDLVFGSADATHHNGDKIDYTMYRSANYCVLAEMEEWHDAASDHHLLRSYKALRGVSC